MANDAAAPKQEVKQEAKKPPVRLIQARMAEAAQRRNVWFVTPEMGVGPEQITDPGYWNHVAAQLRQGDRIEVFPDDGTYYAELLVLFAEGSWAKVKALRVEKLTESIDPPKLVEGYDIKHGGPQLKWRVIRIEDKAVVKEGLNTREEASAWVREHVAALKR